MTLLCSPQSLPPATVVMEACATSHYRARVFQQAGHTVRLRSAWVATRTARINIVRGLLREFGLILPPGAANVVPAALVALNTEALPLPFVEALLPAIDEIRDLNAKIDAIDQQLTRLARQNKDAMRLQQIPGIGVMTATALANKMARMAWAIWRHDRPFNGSFAAA